MITRSDTVGGAQKHVFDISIQLKSDGHDVEIISSGTGDFRDLVEKERINFFDLVLMKRAPSLLDDLKVIWGLRKKISADKPDVLSTHSVKAGMLGRIACIGNKTRVLFTAHGWSHIRSASKVKGKLYKLLESCLSKICHSVICVSLADYNYASSDIGISKKKLRLIPNGVKKTQCQKFNIKSFHEEEVLNLLSVVRFQPPKDFLTLIKGLKLIQGLPWRLKIIGDGDDIKSVRETIVFEGLDKQVYIEGFQSNTSQYYMDADAVLLISKSEGLPMSLLEAMSFSKALIASNVGGIPELIKDGWNGYLIEPDDCNKLAYAIKQLMDNKVGLCESMGHKSYSLFNEKYSFERMMKSLYEVYNAR
ncbi:glycosyltransferase family 4 protein [Psychroserpens sp.]|jgi:glycosyltransferase involved in cell wall biosynthesis|uniref:glycosyltransferase family 4 protein n=1 Tax=Psychroserpens sp. TaxID=2020870 RepID=UPI0039E540BD